jgi:hypothetical protein
MKDIAKQISELVAKTEKRKASLQKEHDGAGDRIGRYHFGGRIQEANIILYDLKKIEKKLKNSPNHPPQTINSSNMQLPKEVQERIKGDAEVWKKGAKIFISPSHIHGYHAGATAEAERSQKLVECLKEITKWKFATGVKEGYGNHRKILTKVIEMAEITLSKYNETK